MTSQIRLIGLRLRRAGVWPAPAWSLKLALRWTLQEIDRLERQLGGEFALLENLPLQQDLERLHHERDRLVRRLAARDRAVERSRD